MTCRKIASLIPLLLLLARPALAELKLITPAGYLPGRPFPVRVEMLKPDGERNWDLWDADVALTVDQPGVTLSTNRVVLRNGLGTALLTISTNIGVTLRATHGAESSVRWVRSRVNELVTYAAGTLQGTSTTWSGMVFVTNNVTVPVGHTLTINPDTIVFINGVTEGTNGITIFVEGNVQALGNEQFPVTITCDNAQMNWGQLRHSGAVPSLYRHTFISKAGRAVGEWHTFTAPAIRVTNSSVTLESCVVSDLNDASGNIGKIMNASGSTLVFRNCVFARARMGPEMMGTGLLCTDSYFLEMRGPDDGDAIYLHDSGGPPISLNRCVLAGGDDDAVDTYKSKVTIENSIIRDWVNPNEDAKGVSVFVGEVILRRNLIVNCFVAVSSKSDGPLGVVRIDHCTITGIERGVTAGYKSNATEGNLQFYITNSIVRAEDALISEFGNDRFVSVIYCNLSESWPGSGNITADPLFVNAAVGNYRLQAGSSCIDAGNPSAQLDRDFSRADIGFYSTAGELPVASPVVSRVSPVPGEMVSSLSSIEMHFSAPVSGVNAADLLINGIPASGLVGAGAGPYRFTVTPPAAGPVQISWAANHGIQDVLNNPFAGTGWNYVLNPLQREVVISEIMYHPATESPLEEFIELHNRGNAPVNLAGWRFTDGIDFTFPNVSIAAGAYLVVVANRAAFQSKYPDVENIVGDWIGTLSNSREDIDLDDASGNRVDSVRYADEGDWALRQREILHFGQRGWDWFAEHDGLGKSAELINASISNNSGQNWESSLAAEGTPGRANSVISDETAPMILNVAHSPTIPRSSDAVVISATISGSASPSSSVTVHYRISENGLNAFTPAGMSDDGQGGDALAGDGIFSATIPPQTNNTVVEFYIQASDALGNDRAWPAPAIPGADSAGPFGQVANALYQVDDTVESSTQPFYKVVMTHTERATLQAIGNNAGGSASSDAQMNATFISVDGTGTDLQYLAGIRNRGHGSRAAKPNNYRVNFRSDQPWKGVLAINLNAQFSWMQVLGAVLHTQAGSVGADSRAVQFRINNVNVAFTGATDRTFGSYAANEVLDADWADHHFPNDGNGNIYRAVRDLIPPNFDYRVTNVYVTLPGPENKNSYTNTWFKNSNVSEDDWTDLIAMLRVLGPNGAEPFAPQNVRRVIDVEQWLLHLAVMNLLGSGETGLNTGHNDDYFLYRGQNETRFKLVYYDLDQILGFNNSYPATSQLFSAALPFGAGEAIGRLLHDPDFEPVYFETLRRLINTTFAATNFNALVDQVLGDFVPEVTRAQLKNYMDTRRAFVLSQLPANPLPTAPRAVVSGTPRSPTPQTSATFQVSGSGITHYLYRLDDAPLSGEIPVQTPIVLTGLGNGSHVLSVIGKNSAGDLQSFALATTASWIVNSSLPAVRLNELISSRAGNEPDQIELFNEGSAPINLAGLRLSDDAANSNRYTFGAVVLNPGAYLVLNSTQLGFSFSAEGEGLFLWSSVAAGGALLDSVEFGQQITGLSIGRFGDAGEWHLAQPSFGAANVLQPLGNSASVKINEWHTAGLSPYPDDFIELYNLEALPVSVGGFYLTDQRVGAPTQNQISPHTFIPAGGHIVFTSGNGNSPDEINFSLAAEQGEIALFNSSLAVIDSIVYGPQRLGISNGRCPDGGPRHKPLQSPTPGGANDCPFEAPPPQRNLFVPFAHTWKYDASGSDLLTAWKEINFDDASWPSGPGAIGFDSDVLPEPLRTTFPRNSATTFYFRTSFNVDPSLSVSSLELTHMIDDGAAFYLNGQEIGTRFNLPPDASASTLASGNVNNPTLRAFSLPATALVPGQNILAVEVHQFTANNADMSMGLQLVGLVITNVPGVAGVVINEVLADNDTLGELDGSVSDWVELYNPSDSVVDLAGMSLTDSPTNPRRWVFPAGSVMTGRGFMRILCDASKPASSTNTGFALSADGGALILYNSPGDGGSIQSSITYGLQASDWSIGRIPDGGTNWVLNIPTPAMANRSASLGNRALLKANEWMADPATGADWFELYNPNAEPVDLSGLWLSDTTNDRDKQILPALSFIGNGARAYCRFEADELLTGANHVAFKLSADGEALCISFPSGALIDAISFGRQSRGVSQGRLLDGGNNIMSFPVSASPGAANYVPLASIVINEVLSHSDPPLMDAVEIFNPTLSPVTIGGWFLSDSPANLRKYQIPPGMVVPAGGYAVIYEDDFNGETAGEAFSFSSADGDEVYLSETVDGLLTGYRAAAQFGPAENGVSFGRVQTSNGFDFAPMIARSFGRDNPATTAEFKLGTGAANSAPRVGPIVMSEIMYHPPSASDALEFIELQNISGASVNLFDSAHLTNTWRLRRGVDFEFPSGTTIPAGGWLVVVGFDPATDPVSLAAFRAAYGHVAPLVGPYRGRLSNSGDVIELLKADSPEIDATVPYVSVDRILYLDLPPWPTHPDGLGDSLQKRSGSLFGNDPANWISAFPNPGTSSNDSDLDGMPNDWERAFGLSETDPGDAALDTDGDGMRNLHEFLAGTNPISNADALRLTPTRAGADLILTFQSAAGRSYTLFYSDVSAAGPWAELVKVPAGASNVPVQITDPGPLPQRRFYFLQLGE